MRNNDGLKIFKNGIVKVIIIPHPNDRRIGNKTGNNRIGVSFWGWTLGTIQAGK